MPVEIIPVNPDQGAQRVSVVLDGTRFVLHLFYIRRTDSWYLHLDTTNGTRLVSGWRLTYLFPVSDISNRQQWPIGTLSVITARPDLRFTDPGDGDLGDTHELGYLPFLNSTELLFATLATEDAEV